MRSRDPNLPPLRPLRDSGRENFLASSAENEMNFNGNFRQNLNQNFNETNSLEIPVTLETLNSGRNEESWVQENFNENFHFSSDRPPVGRITEISGRIPEISGIDDANLMIVGNDSEGIPLIEEQSEDSKFD